MSLRHEELHSRQVSPKRVTDIQRTSTCQLTSLGVLFHITSYEFNGESVQSQPLLTPRFYEDLQFLFKCVKKKFIM